MLTHKQDGEFQNYWCPVDSIRSRQRPWGKPVSLPPVTIKGTGNLAVTDIQRRSSVHPTPLSHTAQLWTEATKHWVQVARLGWEEVWYAHWRSSPSVSLKWGALKMCPSLKQLFLSVELHLRRNALLLCSPQAVDAVSTGLRGHGCYSLKELQDFLGFLTHFFSQTVLGSIRRHTWPSDTQDHLAWSTSLSTRLARAGG